uniref:Exosome component 2 n=1 Tax=Falco tinnunculus TaxID=100819 RepID=A0A8C4UL12_FALTI
MAAPAPQAPSRQQLTWRAEGVCGWGRRRSAARTQHGRHHHAAAGGPAGGGAGRASGRREAPGGTGGHDHHGHGLHEGPRHLRGGGEAHRLGGRRRGACQQAGVRQGAEGPVQQKRWKVETNSRLDSVLLLSSVNLPGGELRRRSAEDELAMRDYLQEGDLISAEVQSVFSDGAVSLHTRSLKYGKLAQGVLVQVSPSLVKRQKTHFHDLPCGASVILGNNGFIWIHPTLEHKDEEAGGFTTNLEPVPLSDREVISRLRNCIVALVNQKLMLFDTSILYCYEASLPHQWQPAQLDGMFFSSVLLFQSSLHFPYMDQGHSQTRGGGGDRSGNPTEAAGSGGIGHLARSSHLKSQHGSS